MRQAIGSSYLQEISAMVKYWVCVGSSLIGPFSDQKVADELCDKTKQVIAIDNDQPIVSEIKLTKVK